MTIFSLLLIFLSCVSTLITQVLQLFQMTLEYRTFFLKFLSALDLYKTYSVLAVLWIEPSWKKMSCFNQEEFPIIVGYTDISKLSKVTIIRY